MTEYLSPDVRVQQISANPTAPLIDIDLYPTLVGPCYRVVRDKTVIVNGPIAKVSEGPAVSFTYPIIDPGAIVDLESVSVKIKDGYVELLSHPSGTEVGTEVVINGETYYDHQIIAGLSSYCNMDLDFVALGITAGDKVAVSKLGFPSSTFVVKEASQHLLTFTSRISTTLVDPKVVVLKHIALFDVHPLDLDASNTNVKIDTVAFNATTYFVSGEVLVSYRALRRDLTGFHTFNNSDDVSAIMEIDSMNKIGLDLGFAGFGANGNSRKILAFILDSEATEKYLDALEDLSTTSKCYMLVPMTNNVVVRNAYSAHAVAMSEFENSLFRMLFTDTVLVTEKELVKSVQFHPES